MIYRKGTHAEHNGMDWAFSHPEKIAIFLDYAECDARRSLLAMSLKSKDSVFPDGERERKRQTYSTNLGMLHGTENEKHKHGERTSSG